MVAYHVGPCAHEERDLNMSIEASLVQSRTSVGAAGAPLVYIYYLQLCNFYVRSYLHEYVSISCSPFMEV